MQKNDLLKIRLSDEEIIKKREQVREALIIDSNYIKSGIISKMSIGDLEMMFNAYDTYFFKKYFRDNFIGTTKFSFSKRMTRSAGMTLVPKNIASLTPDKETYEIRMGVNFFFNYYDIMKEKKVSGIVSKDSLEAFQLVFEHELIHLLEFYIFKKSSCKGARFKHMARNIFGHTDVYHELPTNIEIARQKYDFKVGDKVGFTNENKYYEGNIFSINKRAAVMVLDKKGRYMDSKGNIYTKWYVPIEKLKNK